MSRAQLTSTVEQNTGGAVSPYVAGKNALINGAFDYWQRGTSGFTTGGSYNADRWKFYQDGTGVTATITQQALTAGSIVGVDSPYCFQWSVTVAGSGATTNQVYQLVENVQTFAGQTVVLSFYAKSDATRTPVTPYIYQNFGSGGSLSAAGTVTATGSNPANLTTSWQRFSYTVALPSITGKTVGTSSYLEVAIKFPINTTQVTQVAGVQLEVGSVPTQFSRAGGTLSGELTACQRYYEHNYPSGYFPGSNYGSVNPHEQGMFIVQVPVTGSAAVTRGRGAPMPFAVNKRTTPTMRIWDSAGNQNKYLGADGQGSFLSNNNALDIYGGSSPTIKFANIQTVAASTTHIYCAFFWEASAEL